MLYKTFNFFSRLLQNITRNKKRIEYRKGRISFGSSIQPIRMKMIITKNNAGGEDVNVHIPNIKCTSDITTKFSS